MNLLRLKVILRAKTAQRLRAEAERKLVSGRVVVWAMRSKPGPGPIRMWRRVFRNGHQRDCWYRAARRMADRS